MLYIIHVHHIYREESPADRWEYGVLPALGCRFLVYGLVQGFCFGTNFLIGIAGVSREVVAEGGRRLWRSFARDSAHGHSGLCQDLRHRCVCVCVCARARACVFGWVGVSGACTLSSGQTAHGRGRGFFAARRAMAMQAQTLRDSV